MILTQILVRIGRLFTEQTVRRLLLLLIPVLIIFFFFYSFATFNKNPIYEIVNRNATNWDDFVVTGRKGDDPLLIEYLRDKVLIQPNSLPYNLTDPFMKAKISIALADFAIKIFKGKKNGIFFEAGAYHPESHSMTIYLERYFGWTGILVEPNPINFDTILKANRKSISIRACLSPQNDTQKLSMNINGMQSKLTEAKRGTFFVDCYPVYALLAASKYTTIDYFILDVEGFELEVLKTIPFDKINVKVFAIEHFNLKKPDELKIFVEQKGYKTLEKTTYDFIFIKNGIKF